MEQRGGGDYLTEQRGGGGLFDREKKRKENLSCSTLQMARGEACDYLDPWLPEKEQHPSE